jgi:hypothetical protein
MLLMKFTLLNPGERDRKLRTMDESLHCRVGASGDRSKRLSLCY